MAEAVVPWRYPVDESFLTREKTPTNINLTMFYEFADMLRYEALAKLPIDLEFLKAFAHVTAYLEHFAGMLTANQWTPRNPNQFENFMMHEASAKELPERVLATYEMNVSTIIGECSRPGFSERPIVTEPYDLPDAPINGENYLAGVIVPYMMHVYQQLALPAGF